MAVALKFGVLGVQVDSLGAATGMQDDCFVQHQKTFLRVVGGAYRAARTLRQRKIHRLCRGGNAALLIKGESAGLDVDLAPFGGLSHSDEWFALGFVARGEACLGSNGGRDSGPHQRDFHRARGLRRSLALVVFELAAFNAIGGSSIGPIQVDLHIV